MITKFSTEIQIYNTNMESRTSSHKSNEYNKIEAVLEASIALQNDVKACLEKEIIKKKKNHLSATQIMQHICLCSNFNHAQQHHAKSQCSDRRNLKNSLGDRNRAN